MEKIKFNKKIKTLGWSISLGVAIFTAIPSTIFASAQVGDIVINGDELKFSKEMGSPVSLQERTYIPLRLLTESLGYQVRWDKQTQTTTVEDHDITIDLQMGSSIAKVNGENVYIDKRDGMPVLTTTPVMIEDRIYIPLRFIIETLGFQVDFKDGVTYITKEDILEGPINPKEYQKLLGRGMDVDWSKTKEGRHYYNEQAIKDFKDKQISHVRIRIKDEADEALFVSLDKQIEDCLENGIIPVIAYQADEFKNEPSEKNIKKVIKWWGTVAERYKDVSHLLSFDLLIEATDALNKQPEKLNEIYERIVTEIRKTNPTRIIMISPRLRSDAAYLHELDIPTGHNGYLMAEWHFYASGPSKTNERKLWTTGTDEEKALINEKINLALEWQKETGIPTWVGAWMPGNYNDGNDYTISEQVSFASYMKEVLTQAGIPFAVNSDTKFYNRETNQWIKEMEPVRQCIWGN